MNSRTNRLRSAGKWSPDDQEHPVDAADQSLEGVDDLQLADRTAFSPELKDAQRQPYRAPKSFCQLNVVLQQRCLAARFLGADKVSPAGTQSAFVDEDDRAAQFLDFFLVAGQVLR